MYFIGYGGGWCQLLAVGHVVHCPFQLFYVEEVVGPILLLTN